MLQCQLTEYSTLGMPMKRRIFRRSIWLCFFLLLAALNAAEDPDKFSIEALGVRVSKPSPAKESAVWPTGCAVLLQVTAPVGELIRLDTAASTLTKISDDAGHDMLAKIKGAVELTQIVGISRAYQIDRERKLCAVEAVTPLLPVKGAKSIQIGGTLVFDCARNKRETVVEKVALKSGSKINGPDNLALELEQAGRPDYGRDAWSFVLRSGRELDDLAEIKFFKPDGTELKSTRTSTSALSIFGATKIEWNYSLAEKVDAATVKLYTWTDMKKKKLDFDLKVELGL